MGNTIISSESYNHNIKESFYILSKKQNSEEIHNDLSTLLDNDLSFTILINPYENIHPKTIEVLKVFQQNENLKILIEEVSDFKKTPFIRKGYEAKLNLAGFYNMENDSLIYKGENEIFFNLIHISENPIYSLQAINIAKNSDDNIAIISSSDNFNLSTFILASEEIQGSSLEVSNYTLEVERPLLLYRSFYNIGDIAIIFFIISIIILLITIRVFKIWSQENFFD